LDLTCATVTTQADLLSSIHSDYVVQRRCETLDYLLFLYFGRIRRGMKSFALRDLGIVKTAQKSANYEARFKNRKEAAAAYRCAVLLEHIDQAAPASLLRLLPEISAWTLLGDPAIDERRDRVSAQLGKALERCSEIAAAVAQDRRAPQAGCQANITRVNWHVDPVQGVWLAASNP
jgi:DNA polymerase-3 subunit epsilon